MSYSLAPAETCFLCTSTASTGLGALLSSGVLIHLSRLVFQDSMSFMYQALERNLRMIFMGSSQRPKKHVSSPLASYFSTRPYARLGW